jgi:hypothetical protein
MNMGRIYDCKHFGTARCPNRKEEALMVLENLVSNTKPTYPSKIFEKAEQICVKCECYEKGKRR